MNKIPLYTEKYHNFDISCDGQWVYGCAPARKKKKKKEDIIKIWLVQENRYHIRLVFILKSFAKYAMKNEILIRWLQTSALSTDRWCAGIHLKSILALQITH